MNIRFHNLGKIKETELDLKPMTVIIGPNNSNKTYIAYSIYGLWQSMGSSDVPRPRNTLPLRRRPSGDLVVTVEALHKAFMTNIQRAVRTLEAELENFYQDSSQTLFSQTHYEVDFSAAELRAAVASMSGTKIDMFVGEYTVTIQQDTVHLSPATKSDDLEQDEIEDNKEDKATENLELGRYFLNLLRRRLIFRPYLMPAERNAFVITYKVLANRRLKLLLDAQRRLFSNRSASKKSTQRQVDLLREVGEVRYPQPIEDFLELLFQIENEVKPLSNVDDVLLEASIPKRRPVRRVAQNNLKRLAADIEQNIQNGNKINFRTTALGGQEIMVDVGNGLNIDLYNASSSIKQLAPLLLYLRYRATKGDLLIIDEPEMNLHPESQVKLLEVLAMLVNQGVYVLLTTHSPYIMSHLNNLAQATEVSAAGKRKQAKSLYLGDAAALLDMDQVSAYEMRDNQLHSLKDPDFGIRWDTLSDVSGDLQQKYFQIYEEGHQSKREKTTRKPAKTAGE